MWPRTPNLVSEAATACLITYNNTYNIILDTRAYGGSSNMVERIRNVCRTSDHNLIYNSHNEILSGEQQAT